jgi:hypothetical protein
MEIILRPIPHSVDEVKMGHCVFYPPIESDAISCAFNLNGFTPMLSVLRAYGIDQARFDRNGQLAKGHSEVFSVHVDRTCSPLLITTSRTRTWDDAPQATSQIINIADGEGCKSVCLTHFMFLQGKFPKSAFSHCLKMAAYFEPQSRLKRIIVDVDDRHIVVANRLFVEVCAHQAYALRHRIARSLSVGSADAGSADFQGFLAAEILTKSLQEDRCVEALKWLFLAHNIRWKAGQTEPCRYKSAFEFLTAGMSMEQVDCALDLAEKWLAQKLIDPNDYAEFVPEFRAYIASLELGRKVAE